MGDEASEDGGGADVGGAEWMKKVVLGWPLMNTDETQILS